MRVLIAAVLALALVPACMKESKLYCEKHGAEDPVTCGYQDAAIDARPTCSGNSDCHAPAPFCEPASHYCVECLDNTACTSATKPFCDQSTYTCEGCVTNSDCSSKVCLPTGVCGDDSNTAYVDPASGAHTGCTLAQPCMLVADALTTGRANIKVTGALAEAVTVMGKAVTIIADPGTTLTRPGGAGVVMTVAGGSDVTIYDLRIVGNGEKGIATAMSTLRLVRVAVTGCDGKDHVAIEAKGGALVMSRCQIYGNAGGGLTTDATNTFNITNSVFVHNGDDTSMVGGLKLGLTSSGLNRFELNTVADNRATGTSVGGLSCGALGFTTSNNIISRNYSGGSATGAYANTSAALAGCQAGNSIVAADVAALKFVMPDGTGPWDYHIQAGSSALDTATTTDIGFDLDGNIRPQGPGVDIGADELKQ